jgi:uncharacterized surface protein with fasciclin (FAS1) repeats
VIKGMMVHFRNSLFLVAIFLLMAGCDPDLKKEDKYARPDWLAGKVYTQLKAEPDLSTFALCVERTGYDTLIDRSGSYTLFAPNNTAFAEFFAENPLYSSVEEIPLPELKEIVKYHIVQNPWTKEQLRTLDVYGWIDTLDLNNNKPRGFKRQTLLLEDNRKLGVAYQQDKNIRIVDTLASDWHRMVATDSRKYAPIFFREYLDIYDLGDEDYEFYFGRPIGGPQELFFAGGKIIGDEIFAENGFVYEIDRVIVPLSNAYQMMEKGAGNQVYTDFLDLVNLFPGFQYNEQKTYDQPGADEGYAVDSLFDLAYPELTFDILNEKTTPPSGTYGLPSNVTIRYHHGLIAPTNAALNDFVHEYLAGANRWGTLEDAPRIIKRIIVNTHMSDNCIYPSDFTKGFMNGEKDLITLEADHIVHKEFGSNSSFIGVDKAVVPRVFTSVAGPVYLVKGYSKVMYAIERAGLLSALKRDDTRYLFYVESNTNTTLDSSLLYSSANEVFSLFQNSATTKREFNLSTSDLRALLLNHIATGSPTGLPRKEFIKNLAGNFLIINNETGEVSGTAPTTFGYMGLVREPNLPVQISTDAVNGITYDVNNWFSFSAPPIYSRIQGSFPLFHELLIRAGLANEFEGRLTFLSENEDYTIFAPTDEALIEYGADTLTGKALEDFLKFHFIQGDLIFTDGSKPPGYYETARLDERSTTYTKIFSRIYIDPGIDIISVPGKQGGDYLSLEESESTNIMTGRDAGESTEIFRNLLINGVIHEIDRVLVFDEVDTQ